MKKKTRMARACVAVMLNNLIGRRGYDDLWRQIDDETRREIKDTLVAHVRENLKPKHWNPFTPDLEEL